MPTQIGYARVSTREQAQETNALDNQIARIRAVIGPDAPLFTDVMRGEKSQRPGFEELRKAVETGAFEEVVVTRVDRLGRNTQTGFQQILSWWTGNPKIRTHCLQHPIDLDALGGRFNLALMAEAAIFEVDMLSTRIRSTWAGKMQAGEVEAPPPFGYRQVGTKMVPDQTLHCPLGLKPADGSEYPGISNAELAQLAFTVFIETTSYARAVDALWPYALTLPISRKELEQAGRPRQMSHEKFGNERNCIRPVFPPTNHTLRNWCFNPIYRGHRGHRRNYDPSRRPANGDQVNRMRIQGSADTYEFFHRDVHEPLITEAQYQDILAIESRFKAMSSAHLAQGGKPGPGPATAGTRVNVLTSLPLTGFLFCAECGNRLNSSTIKPGNIERYRDTNKTYHYYKCINSKCRNYRMSISPTEAIMQLAWHLCQKAKAVQEGKEVVPAASGATQARVYALQSTLLKLNEIPERALVADKIQEIQRELQNLEANKRKDGDFLNGTGRELLLSPKAAEWNHWMAYLKDPHNVLVKVPQLVRRIDVGYACEEDRPAPRTGPGRPRADQVGRPSILQVEVR